MYGSPAHRYDALILHWRWFLWQNNENLQNTLQFQRPAKTQIHLSTCCSTIFFTTTELLYDAKSLIPLCQDNQTQISGSLEFNAWTQNLAVQVINELLCIVAWGQSDDWGFGPGQWCPWGDDGHLLTHSRSLDYNTWRRTHKPTAQYSHSTHTHSVHRQHNNTHSIQTVHMSRLKCRRSNTRRPADIRPLR